MKITCKTRFGSEVPVYDDGLGRLWVYRESLGVRGIARAQTWEDAWEIAVDEFMDEADPADPDVYARSYDPEADPADLAEGCYYMSGARTPGGSCIAIGDVNGEALDELTLRLADDLGIVVSIEADDDEEEIEATLGRFLRPVPARR